MKETLKEGFQLLLVIVIILALSMACGRVLKGCRGGVKLEQGEKMKAVGLRIKDKEWQEDRI